MNARSKMTDSGGGGEISRLSNSTFHLHNNSQLCIKLQKNYIYIYMYMIISLNWVYIRPLKQH